MEKKRAEVMGSLSLLVVAIIWGSGFIASQMALDAQMSSAFIMFVRFAIAALIVGIVFHKDLKKNMKKEHIKGGLLIGTFLFLAFYVQTVALQYTTPSNNAFITAANVVIVPFLWWAISKKKPGAKFIVSSFLCLLGIGIFSTCLCYFLQTTAQQHVHSAKAAIILSTESLFGTIFSVLLGYDPLSPQMVVGGIIILISITMTEIKLPFGKKEKPILVEKRED